MEPITGFALYLLVAVLVGVVAAKRGRRGWLFTLGVLVGGPAAAMLASSAGAGGLWAAITAFLVPLVGLMLASSVASGDEVAAREGSYRGLRKCPHCAESIKAEARVCKYCGRDVAPAS